MKKIKVLALIMVFAFAALGGAYAMWSDSLVIAESVKTGTLNVQFLDDNSFFNPDPGPNYEEYDGDVYGVDEGNEGLDELDNGNPNNNKNIAFMEAVISDQEDDASAYDNEDDLLTITLENGYPGYQERIFTTIANTGTVPAKFDIATNNVYGVAEDLLVEIWFDADPTKAKDNGEDYMIWSNTGVQPELALQGYQIDPGEEIPVAIYTRVKQAAAQDATYEFSIKLTAQQWNEYGFPLGDALQTIDREDPWFDGDNGVQPVEPKFAD